MKVVILAGGLGSRISEKSHLIPKPMIEIGGKPILWHIMKYYLSFGHDEFIILCGYKQYVIKEFFANYFLHMSDITFDYSNNNKIIIHKNNTEKWKVTLIDTGLDTMTGGRIKKIKDYVGDCDFLLTYGDGVSNVDVNQLIKFHKSHNKLLTLTAIQPGGRFGTLEIKGDDINSFVEKSIEDGGWINGGYMVVNSKVLDYIEGDTTIFENEPLQRLAIDGNLKAFKHYGFWQCMDTLRDHEYLEKLICGKCAPWIVWEDLC